MNEIAAVDQQNGSVDERRLVRRQEQRYTGDVLRKPEPVRHRLGRRHTLPGTGNRLADGVSLNQPRQHRPRRSHRRACPHRHTKSGQAQAPTPIHGSLRHRTGGAARRVQQHPRGCHRQLPRFASRALSPIPARARLARGRAIGASSARAGRRGDTVLFETPPLWMSQPALPRMRLPSLQGTAASSSNPQSNSTPNRPPPPQPSRDYGSDLHKHS